MTSLDDQIAALEQTAIDYAISMCDEKFTNDQMRDYWLNVGQGWMLLIGLRRAQLVSLRRYHGMTLIA